MSIDTDFSVATNGNIRYTGAAHGASGAGYYTVLELHRWLQDLADNSTSSGDDYMDISRLTPSDRSYDTIITLLNGYNIDDTASEHLYGGSIIQTSGDVIYDGVQVIAGSGCNVQIIQNGARLTNDFWNSTPYGAGVSGLNADAANNIAMKFLLKVRTGAADIDGRRLLLQTRVLGYTYSEFQINGTSRGINVAALTYLTDLNNQTASGTISGWSSISNLNQGYIGIDANGDSSNEFYYSKWTKGSQSIPQLYEYIKYLTRRGTSSTLYGLNGELFRGVTHEVACSGTHSGTFSAYEALSWGSGGTAGTGQLLAVDVASNPTKLWVQLLTGVAPSGTVLITGGTSGATATNSGTPTARTVPGSVALPPCGQCTGTAIIGAYGFGIQASDLGTSDRVTDLTNTVRTPPNLVTFTVAGLVANADEVLVGPATGSALNTSQFTLNGALTGASVTSVVVNESIPADTPASGKLRILRADGSYTSHAYSAVNSGTKTFTISSTNFSTNNAANGAGCYLAYIDQLITVGTTLSFQTNYSSDRSLFVRRRFAGTGPSYSDATKTFEGIGTLGASGGSVTVQRISDA